MKGMRKASNILAIRLLRGGLLPAVASAAKIAKAREKARLLVAKKCTDATLSDLASCGRTVDELIDSGLSSGCLIESVEDNVERVFADGFGY